MRTTLVTILFFSFLIGIGQDCTSIKDCFMDAYDASDYEKMKKVYAQAAEENATDSAKAYMQTGIGLIMNDKGLFDECRPFLQRAIALDPKNAEDPLIGLGNSYLNQRKYAEAIPYYDQVIEKNDKNVQAWYFKGLSFYFQMNDAQAITCFKAAQKLIPVRTVQGTGDDAIFTMQIGDTSIPKAMRANIHYYVGLLTDDNATAINEQNKALADDPYHGRAFFERGKRKYFLKNYPEAIADLSKSVDGTESKNKFAWYYLGMTHYYAKNYAQAANCLAEARTVGPPFYTAVYYEGMAIWYYAGSHQDQWTDLYKRIVNNFEYVIANSDDAALVEKAKKSLYDLNN